MLQPIRDIAVIGGSHAGLFAAIALANAGFDVHVYERNPEILRGTGGGIRVQPLLAETLQREAGIDVALYATRTRYDRHLAPRKDAAGNTVVFEQAEDGRFASWGSLYRALLARFGRDRYHCGETCVGTTEQGDKVEVRFASGRTALVDLVVFADGIGSTGRRRLNPAARMQYAGYVAWRGLVPKRTSVGDPRGAARGARLRHPGAEPRHPLSGAGRAEAGATISGERRVNAMWYRNVAEGAALDELMTDRDGTHRPTSARPACCRRGRWTRSAATSKPSCRRPRSRCSRSPSRS